MGQGGLVTPMAAVNFTGNCGFTGVETGLDSFASFGKNMFLCCSLFSSQVSENFVCDCRCLILVRASEQTTSVPKCLKMKMIETNGIVYANCKYMIQVHSFAEGT